MIDFANVEQTREVVVAAKVAALLHAWNHAAVHGVRIREREIELEPFLYQPQIETRYFQFTYPLVMEDWRRSLCYCSLSVT